VAFNNVKSGYSIQLYKFMKKQHQKW